MQYISCVVLCAVLCCVVLCILYGILGVLNVFVCKLKRKENTVKHGIWSAAYILFRPYVRRRIHTAVCKLVRTSSLGKIIDIKLEMTLH